MNRIITTTCIAVLSCFTLPSQLSAQPQLRVRAPQTNSLPLNFEPNVGQTDVSVKYLVHGGRQTLFLTGDHAVLRLSNTDASIPRARNIQQLTARNTQAAALRMRFRNSRQPAAIEALDPLPGKINYIIGKNPANWHTDIPTYGRVAYRGVYPGIDLVYYGTQGALEYDFVAQPGADTRAIQVDFEGADGMQVNADGDLVLQTAAGAVRWKKPTVYQDDHGVRRQIAADYRLKGSRVGFQLARYNRKLPLVIDPVLVYSTFIGGNGDDSAGVVVDPTGMYIGGTTASTNFPTTAGAISTSLQGENNPFMMKLNPQGTALIYSTYLGGSTNDAQNEFWVGTDGTVYMTGFTASFDFPTTPGAFSTQYNDGYEEAFVLHLSAQGNSLIFSTYLGGRTDDDGYGMWVDLSGNIYITGETQSNDFPVTTGAYQTRPGGGTNDVFVTKLDPTGSRLLYSTYLGGTGDEALQNPNTGPAPPHIIFFFGSQISVDLAGNAYITGVTTSSNFPTTAGAYSRLNNGGSGDGFLTELNPTGTALVASTLLGGTGFDAITSHQVDPAGNVLVAGVTGSTTFPTTAGAYSRTYHGGATDAFIARFNSSFSQLTYSTLFGGTDQEAYVGAVQAGNGTVLLSGLTYSNNLPTTAGTFQTTYKGAGDIFMSFFDSTITNLLDSTYLGTTGLDDGGAGFSYLNPTDILVSGHTQSGTFPTTAGAFQRTFGGGDNPYDGFVAHFQFTGGCNETVNPTMLQVGASGGPQSVTISAPAGCVWFAYPNASWLSITSSATGTGGGTVNFNVPANSGLPRTGTVNVAGLPVTIQQAGAISQCTFTLNPTSANLSYIATTGTIALTASSPACSWTASSNASWLTITSASSGSGSATVNYSVQLAPTSRTGTLTIAGQTFTVNQAAPGQTAGLLFVPVTPCRVMDTRNANGPFGGPIMTGGSTRSVTVPGSSCGIPNTALAYSLNITVVPTAQLGYLSVWPTGQVQPVVSTLNSLDGRIVANAAIVPAGTNGAISLFVSDTTQVIIDINGYFAPSSTAGGLAFYPVTPCRVVDTRGGGFTGQFGPPFMAGNSIRSFPISTSPCLNQTFPLAYSFNITVVPHGTLGYLTVWPSGVAQPTVSTLNSLDGSIVANAAIVPAGGSGSINMFVTNDTDVIIDINGYFSFEGLPGAEALYPVTPCRVVDTRGGGVFTGNYGPPTLANGATRSFSIPAGPCSGIPANAQAFSLNATVVPQGPLSYLTAWPTGLTQPVVSTLNSLQGKIVANAALVPAGSNGSVSVFVAGRTDLILDINAYFAP